MAFIERISSVQCERLNPDEYSNCDTAIQCELKYFSIIEDIINKTILGSEDCPAQWKLPIEKKTGSDIVVGTINLENYKVRDLLQYINDIIDASISDVNSCTKWRRSVMHYKHAMLLCRKGRGLHA